MLTAHLVCSKLSRRQCPLRNRDEVDKDARIVLKPATSVRKFTTQVAIHTIGAKAVAKAARLIGLLWRHLH